jgi:serine/threonine protein kinase/Tfp pilus assembly protein PilF
MEEYLEAVEAGTAPPREEFLARYPDLADDLDGCLAALRFIGRAAEGPRSVVAEVAGMEPPAQSLGQLGDFRLIREVGRGGMGVVYEAEQVSLGRRVALKVLPFAATMDPRQLQRFHNEARAAASLDHPHIVHVHAIGCERAVHFYAMQFIEGQTLAAMIADLRQRGGRPAEAQPTTPHFPEQPEPAAETAPWAAASTERGPRDRAHFRRVAELGIQAAEALDYAHALGIVHRDVKPANLLVDGRGGLWVADFGLAHIQSDARLTLTGDLVGTLRYMSPEQALAKQVVVDYRTDVYSLGATLYELLTLEPAFGGCDRQELLRQIAFEEPKPPRRINKAIPAELETIIQKAMEKDPADRYATAKELAEDLRRFLADEPIRARRPGPVRRSAKWARRHPSPVVAAVVVLLMAGLLGGGAGLWWAQKRAGAEGEARAALREADRLRQEEKWPEALGAARRAKGALAGVWAAPDLRQQVEESAKDLEMALRLQEASLLGDALKDGHFDGEACNAAYADAFEWYGLDLDNVDPREAAERLRSRSIPLQLAAALDDWAYVRSRYKLGEWRPLAAMSRAVDPDPWRDRLRDALEGKDPRALDELTASVPSDELPPATAVFLAGLSRGTSAAGPALLVLRQVQQRHPADFWVNLELGACLAELQPPHLEEAIRYDTAAVALRPQSPGAHVNLGNALKATGQLDEAITEYREAARLNKDFAPAHYQLGAALRAKGHLDEAIAAHRQALRIKEDYAEAHHGLGVALSQKGQRDEAIAEYRKAIRIKNDLLEAHVNLGFLLQDKGQLDEAIAVYREAIHVKPDFTLLHNNLGNALRSKGHLDEAIAEYREAVRLQKDYATAYYNLGLVLQDKGQLDEAIAEFREAIRLKKDYTKAHNYLGNALRMKGVLDRLPGILKGEARPADAADCLALADLCQRRFQRRYAASARFFGDAFAAEPRLADDLSASNRYNAACAAALAGCGAGEDAGKLSDAERAKLRKQSLDWLRADLDAWRGLLDKAPPVVGQKMYHRLHDPDFNGVRGPDALGKLPEAERKEWGKLWADVADTLAQARGKTAPEQRPDTK